MPSFRPLLLGVSLAALSSSAFAQTSPDEVTALKAQVAALTARLEALETRQDQQASSPQPILRLPTATSSSPAVAAQTTTDWSSGMPEFRSPDGQFTFRPRARVTADLSTTTGSDFDGRNLTGTELRGVRLGAQGKIAGGFSYWVETDLADNVVSLKNVFLAYTRKVGDQDLELTFGQRLNDRGVEGTSAEDVTPLLERNFANALLGPQRGSFGLGVTAKVIGDTWHASLAATGDEIGTGTASDSISLSTRAHWSALKSDAGFLHLGGWAYVEDLSSDVTVIRRSGVVSSRFNDNLRLASGDYTDPDGTHGFGLELGGVRGPGWIMVEAGQRSIDVSSGDRFDQDAASITLGYFLTGETPPLSTRTGSWTRPRVKTPFGTGGRGAFELVGRYDMADLTDSPTGGEADTVTLGVNWYPTNNTRVSFNVTDWSVDNPTGTFVGPDEGQTATVRVQAGF